MSTGARREAGVHPAGGARIVCGASEPITSISIGFRQPDHEVPIEDTLGALNELVASAGKVRESLLEFSADQLRRGRGCSSQRRRALRQRTEPEYSLLHREPEDNVIPECVA